MKRIIVEDITFTLELKPNEVYKVNAYIQDIDYSDMYTVEIENIFNKEDKRILYVDSCGNLEQDMALALENDKVMNEVYNILFINSHHGIIRGF